VLFESYIHSRKQSIQHPHSFTKTESFFTRREKLLEYTKVEESRYIEECRRREEELNAAVGE
jgi:hypothetical protein